MKNNSLVAVGIIIVILVIAGLSYFLLTPKVSAPGTTATSTVTTTNTTPTNDVGTTSSDVSSYIDQGKIFTFMYPPAISISGGGVKHTREWMQNASADGLLLVRASLASAFEPKTNFGDAVMTVGSSADAGAVSTCSSTPVSGGGPAQKSVVTINGTTFTKFVTTDAAAGNRYETTSYRTVRNNQCYAIEYTIHYSNIDNYSHDQGITAFDKAKVQNILESMVRSFKFLN